MNVGIESINFYGGPAYIDVRELFRYRGLDLSRFDNLLMEKKSVGLPCEDGVTNAVNAAKPLIDQMTESEKNSIEMVITCSESGVDFGKSMSTYVHDYLELNRNCRLFELKQACYGGTAGLHMASAYVASNISPGAKVLVVATDIARSAEKNTYAEPTQAVGAVAMIISNTPRVFELDFGANGLYSYEVMDTCRPEPELELGDADLSLMSYLNCLENSYLNYASKVEDLNYRESFDYLAFHTPFAGMVKGAHRQIMRKQGEKNLQEITDDFERRVQPSLHHCVKVGNVYSATVYLALCGLVDSAPLEGDSRVGIFSYGSGCSSEFYSGLISAESKRELEKMDIAGHLASRLKLELETYDEILDLNVDWMFGIKDKSMDFSSFQDVYDRSMAGRGYLVLNNVNHYHREYVWS